MNHKPQFSPRNQKILTMSTSQNLLTSGSLEYEATPIVNSPFASVILIESNQNPSQETTKVITRPVNDSNKKEV